MAWGDYCTAPKCNRMQVTRGYCRQHFERLDDRCVQCGKFGRAGEGRCKQCLLSWRESRAIFKRFQRKRAART